MTRKLTKPENTPLYMGIYYSLQVPEYELDEENNDVLTRGETVFVTNVTQNEVEFSCHLGSFVDEPKNFSAVFGLASSEETAEYWRRNVEPLVSFQEQQVERVQTAKRTSNLPVTTNPENHRAALRTTRGDLQRLEYEMKKQQERLTELFETQRGVLRHRMNELSEITKRVNEALYTLDVYVGGNEQTVQLSGGEPCSVDEKVHVRQLVLYMDEECAVTLGADKGGIGFEDIKEFDAWLSDTEHPERLQQVLPEPKGIVALKPRRSTKNRGHDDAWTNALIEQADVKTYFLIRNGDNLYRVCNNLEVEDRLFPTRTEFDELFIEKQYDFDAKQDVERRLRPGDACYMKRLEEADGLHRHYLRVLLFLQGLFDRTKVFEPYEGLRVNLGDPREYEQVLTFVHDAEFLLPEGQVSFFEWQRDLNSRLQPGRRVIGAFRSFACDKENISVHPSSASLPPGQRTLHDNHSYKKRFSFYL